MGVGGRERGERRFFGKKQCQLEHSESPFCDFCMLWERGGWVTVRGCVEIIKV